MMILTNRRSRTLYQVRTPAHKPDYCTLVHPVFCVRHECAELSIGDLIRSERLIRAKKVSC